MSDEPWPERPAVRTWREVSWKPLAKPSDSKTHKRRQRPTASGASRWLIGVTAREWYLCAALTLLAAIVRYTELYTQSLTMDEGSSLLITYARPDQFLPNILRNDTHPPLYYLLVRSDLNLLHLAPIDALRIPSLLAGALTVAVMYLLARLLMGRTAGMVAALLTICSPIAVWYSHDGRMYALTWLFVLLSYALLVLALRRMGWFWTLGYSFALALALYSDISSWLAVAPQAVLIGVGLVGAYLSARPREGKWSDARLRAWASPAIGFVLGLLFFLPWLLVFPQQLSLIKGVSFGAPSAQVYWQLLLNDIGLAADYAFLPATVPEVAAIAILATFAVAAVALAWGAFDACYRLYCGVTAALTVGVACVFGLAVLDGSSAVLVPRVIGVGAFGFILLGAGAVGVLMDIRLPLSAWATAVGAKRYARVASGLLAVALTTVLVTGMAAALLRVGADGDNLYRWNDIAAQITNQAGPNDVVMYYPLGVKSVIDPYLPDTSPWREAAVGLWPAPEATAQAYFQQNLPGHSRIWFIFYASSVIHMPVYDDWIRRMGYCRSQGDPSARYGLIVYIHCSPPSSAAGSGPAAFGGMPARVAPDTARARRLA